MPSAEVEDLWERQGKKPKSYHYCNFDKAMKKWREKLGEKPKSELAERIQAQLDKYKVVKE